MPPNVLPPTSEELRIFSLGKSEPARASEIESYLAEAADCTAILATAPEDDLLRHLRGAGELPKVDGPQLSPSPSTVPGPPAGDTGTPPEPAAAGDLGVEAARLIDHPRYRIIRKLGQGGMGTVYLAEHRLMRRQVAIKVIRSRYLGNPQFVERFRREMQAAASLSHPHIVTAFDAEEVAGTHFLVMEYVEGQSLDRWLAEHGPLPAAEACAYGRQAALGLQLAHEKGMVHRDIKPHNLMRTTSSSKADAANSGATVKILDFGLARVLREGLQQPGEPITAEGTVMGTADYMAPEQGRDSRRADIRADIYSLGCTLYHLLSGSVPFPQGTAIGKILKHSIARPEPISSFRQDVPAGLVQIIDKMMAKKPEERYQTPGEVAAALALYLPGMEINEPAAATTPALQPVAASVSLPPPGRLGHWPLLLMATVGVALLGLGVAWLIGAFRGETP